MNRITIFGKPANGKSTLSKKLASATGIKLYSLDSILYQPNGEEVNRQSFEAIHESIISGDEWIVEGFGPLNSLNSFNRRLEKADTLIYIDLPYFVTYWLVTKRCLKGLFIKPEGWPEGSSILKGTLESYKTLRVCHKFWNDDFLQNLKDITADKSLHVIRSVAELNSFVEKNI